METIIGIDLGTTNSEVAVFQDGKPIVLKKDGQALLPSVVGLDANGNLLLGHAARNQALLAPERTVKSIKRKMGEETTVSLGDKQYRPEEISAIILRTLKQHAEESLGHAVSKAVITVPAFFNDLQREKTRLAGELAGLEVVRIINEPTAATLTYETDLNRREQILVYDLGGGTFDVSIVRIEGGVIEVLASHGDTHLGGDDFDQLLFEEVCERFKKQHRLDIRDSAVARSRTLYAVEEAKKQLSLQPFVKLGEEFILEKDGTPLHLDLEIQRHRYEELITPLLEKTLTCLDAALSDAKLNVTEIDKVILVGGASRTPLVQQFLEQRMGQPIHAEVDPDLCVVLGAAVQGALVAGQDVGPVLVDITPHTLGVSALGDLPDGSYGPHCFAPVIKRNTPVPCRRSEMFYTSINNQKTVQINVFQGEAPDTRMNAKIGEFLLTGLAAVPEGNEILCEFELDIDGILHVTATEKHTGTASDVTVENALSEHERKEIATSQESLRELFAAAGYDVSKFPDDVDFGDENDDDLDDEYDDEDSESEEVIDIPVKDVSESVRPSFSESLEQKYPETIRLLQKASQTISGAAAEDAKELETLIQEVVDAVNADDKDKIVEFSSRLEDLLFYLG